MDEFEPQRTPEVWLDRKSDCDIGETASHSNELSEEEKSAAEEEGGLSEEEEVDKGDKMKDHETEPEGKTSVIMTALMKLSGIRIDSYPQMYRKYRNDRGRLDEDFKAALSITLAIVERISREFPGKKCVQDCLGVSEDLVTLSLTRTVFDARIIGNVVYWLRDFVATSTHRPIPDYRPSLEKRPRYNGKEVHEPNSPLNDGRKPSSTVPPNQVLRPVDTHSTFKTVFIQNDKHELLMKSPKMNGDLAVKLEVYDMDKISGLQEHEWWENAEFKAFLPIRTRSSANRAVRRLREELVDVIDNQPDVKGIWKSIDRP